MLLAVSPTILLACVTSLLIWPLQQAHTLIYRGCAYRAVVGKEQALWFCMADNLCAMFYCQDNNVFSADDCGCVPAHRRKGDASSGKGQLNANANAVTMTTPHTSTPSAVLSGGSSTSTLPLQQTAAPDCQREIHIAGLTASGPAGSGPAGGGRGNVYIEARGVVDLGNGSTFYDGYSYLAVPMYTNARFQSGISVDFVLEEGTSTLRQVLMTNCKHGQGASVEIVLDVELGVILFHIMYRFREAVNQVESVVEVAVPYQAFVPKRVALVFDGRWLRGRVNGNERSASVQGNGDYVLAQRAKPLMFGNTLCDVDDVYSFRGQIKQISIYRCVKRMADLFS